jgi:hypothetical protein
MTLQKLLDLKLIHDNVHILVDTSKKSHASKYEEEFQVNRIMGRVVTKDDLIKAGVREEHFSYQVESIWGDKHPFKMGIVIKDQKKKGKV